MRVLLVEDDPLLGSAAKLGLEQDGFSAVDWVTGGAAADRALDAYRYDAIVLDLGLPDIDGEQLLRGWRARAEDTPVIVLTARGFVLDRVRLLNLGADDYLVKPFDIGELCARIRSVVRRTAGKSGEVLACGSLTLYPESRTVRWRGAPVEVSGKEFWLLEALARNRPRIMTRRQLEDALYGWGHEVGSNAVEVHIHNLRRKLAPEIILTVRGSGYRINDERL